MLSGKLRELMLDLGIQQGYHLKMDELGDKFHHYFQTHQMFEYEQHLVVERMGLQVVPKHDLQVIQHAHMLVLLGLRRIMMTMELQRITDE